VNILLDNAINFSLHTQPWKEFNIRVLHEFNYDFIFLSTQKGCVATFFIDKFYQKRKIKQEKRKKCNDFWNFNYHIYIYGYNK